MNAAIRLRLVRPLVLIALTILALAFFVPLIWMVLSSFKSNSEIFSAPFAPPTQFDFSQWAVAWEGA